MSAVNFKLYLSVYSMVSVHDDGSLLNCVRNSYFGGGGVIINMRVTVYKINSIDLT